MKKFITFLIFTLLVTPICVMAQVVEDGVGGYWDSWNDQQQKINDLGNTAEASIEIPILFGVKVSDLYSSFGAPRDGGARTHLGDDIMSPKGVPIVSPTKAIVLRAGDGGTEGTYVYTANPGGETFVYYHLDKIGENITSGLVLEQGDLIGYVGNTGNASGGADHLHFEIHDSSNTALDPFPRLTGEFTLQEKISYLAKILTQTSDSKALVGLLMTNFRKTFNQAISEGIVVPAPINFYLVSNSEVPITATNEKYSVSNDLSVGSTGSAVITLQKYLIQENSGLAAKNLAEVGSTGYFGSLTQAALVEFQKVAGISPSNGYCGVTTQAYISAHPLGMSSPIVPISTPNNSQEIFTRDLYLGISGEDVRTLQKLLNAKGYLLATSGAGSPGNETTYFGSITENAVIKFQKAKGISPAEGNVGPLTRAVLEKL
jgi:peptidoglycan hydrolase-like protein with peptidoglycan-binding domain